jgi:Protein of unknown function (DUF3089)
VLLGHLASLGGSARGLVVVGRHQANRSAAAGLLVAPGTLAPGRAEAPASVDAKMSRLDRIGRVAVSRGRAVLLVVMALSAAGLAGCGTTGQTTIERPDAAGTVWLCRPGLPHNPCTASLRTTVISGNGSARVVDYQPARNPPIDCFYLYPNVTHQHADNANLDVDPQETAIAELEASPFSRSCRVFAPMYREATGESKSEASYQIALHSVEAAWNDYLEHYNDGRGFVLIGHSEGTGLLGHVIIDQIEHDAAVRRRLVSALLIGGNLPVGTNGQLLFEDRQIQPCRSDRQIGCVVGYDSFSAPPPANALFGRQSPASLGGQAVETLCTNPASLSGGPGGLVSLYRTQLPTEAVAGSTAQGIFASHPPTSSTAWIEFDGQYSAQCVHRDGASVLLVTARHHAPALTAAPTAAWGLHLDDPNVALGNLVAIVHAQAEAYGAGRPPST